MALCILVDRVIRGAKRMSPILIALGSLARMMAGIFLGTTRTELLIFFFSSRRRHTRCSRDWSSDVCSSDLRSVPETPGLDPAEPERSVLTDPGRKPGVHGGGCSTRGGCSTQRERERAPLLTPGASPEFKGRPVQRVWLAHPAHEPLDRLDAGGHDGRRSPRHRGGPTQQRAGPGSCCASPPP